MSDIFQQLQDEVRLVPDEYLPELLDLVREFREKLSIKNAEVSVRQGWKEALQEDTLPINNLWDDTDGD